MVARLQIEGIREHRPVVLQIAFDAAVIFVADFVELTGICDWQVLQQHSVDEREDSRVSSDADGQREQRGKCESWRLAQLPQRVSNVLCQSLHRFPQPPM